MNFQQCEICGGLVQPSGGNCWHCIQCGIETCSGEAKPTQAQIERERIMREEECNELKDNDKNDLV